MIRIFFIFSIVLFPIFSNSLKIDGSRDFYILSPHIYFLEDKSREQIFENIQTENYLKNFQLNKKDFPSFGITKSAYWFFIEYESSDNLENYILEIKNPLLDHITVFYKDTKNIWINKVIGKAFPFSERQIEHRNFLFPMNGLNKQGRIFFRITTDGSMQVPITIHKQTNFWEKDQKFLVIQMVFLGLMGAMILYNVLLGFSLKDKTYFLFIVYLISATLLETSLNGISFQFFWPDFNNWNQLSIPVFLSLANLGISAFINAFLDLRKNIPLFHKGFRILSGIALFSFILCFILPYSQILRVTMLIAALSSILSLVAAFIISKKGFKPAKIYLIAWFVFFTGLLFLTLNRFEIVPLNFFTENSALIGFAFKTILISFALADKVNILNQEKQKVQEEYITLFNNLNVGAYRNTGGQTGSFLKANPAIAKMFGYETVEEFMKTPVSELYANPEERNNFFQMMKERKECYKHELVLKRKDNSHFYAALSAKLYYDRENKNFYMDGVIDDITEAKENQKLLELERAKSLETFKKALQIESKLNIYKNELDLAKKIQQSMIPKVTPVLDGFEIFACYKPMESIGGDFYDFQIKGDFFGFVIADVSGHGVPAALIVSTFKTAFWFQDQLLPKILWFQEKNLPKPEFLLASMNSILRGKSGGEFVTACYGYIDMKRKILKVGNAGHHDLLIYRKKESKVYSLNPKGAALCIFSDSKYESVDFQLEQDDRIFLYTDGLFEVRNENDEIFGEQRLLKMLKENSSLPPNEFGDLLLREVMNWSIDKDNIEDDIAFILIDITK